MTETAGVKYDSGKVRLELLSSKWLFGVGQVLTFGAKKYAAHNWRKGLEITRLLGAALRHIFLFLAGENLDPESGLCHLYHASCCLMFASELFETRPELDDRWKPEPSKKCSCNPELGYHPETCESRPKPLDISGVMNCFGCGKSLKISEQYPMSADFKNVIVCQRCLRARYAK